MRKNLLVVAVLCLSSIGFSQNKNFVVEDRLMVWRLVYEDPTPISALEKNFRLEFVTDSTGFIKRTNFENRRLNQFTAEFKIESKKDKYRVSVHNIIFFDDLIRTKTTFQTIPEYTIESQFMKNDGTIRKAPWGLNLTEILNTYFTELFTIKKTDNSDW
ncbi:hypothetical protein [Flavobacterium seoulense]|uniref:DUF4468 domain-containing protein n=1 Tax=Flavobacterium seoulense TaxID=1492738 RepID=A0A066WYA6_9FLAO|nr:hypothetical protein [Flavobacterium seoulense]KDN55889.1 hypothetical protein FEM21_10800 [Flavobacterium seoulense]